MSFSIMNANVVSTFVGDVGIGGADTPFMMLPTGNAYPLFSTPGVVDVTGMEFAIAMLAEAATTVTQDLASGASTVELTFFDMGTTATKATTNPLAGADAFSNTAAGGYTAHEAKKTAGTSTTDLDADDWINLGVIANATGVAGVGAVLAGVNFVYGKPGAIN